MSYYRKVNSYNKHILSHIDGKNAVNHGGYITDEQVKMLRNQTNDNIRFTLLSTLVDGFLVTLVLLNILYNPFPNKIILIIVILPFLWAFLRDCQSLIWEIQTRNILKDRIVSQTGVIRKYNKIKDVGFFPAIQLNTDGEIFRVPLNLLRHLDIGKVYTIYYLQGTKTVVSLYKVDAETSVRVIKDELKYLEALETDLKVKNNTINPSR